MGFHVSHQNAAYSLTHLPQVLAFSGSHGGVSGAINSLGLCLLSLETHDGYAVKHLPEALVDNSCLVVLKSRRLNT